MQRLVTTVMKGLVVSVFLIAFCVFGINLRSMEKNVSVIGNSIQDIKISINTLQSAISNISRQQEARNSARVLP